MIKVFHSARQDLEIVWNLGGIVPAPLFDTQVAAMVCGYGDSVSYEQLVNDLAKAQDRQVLPLHRLVAPAAHRGAAHLRALRRHPSGDGLRGADGAAEANGRLAWLSEEMAVLTSPETYQADPENAWRRLVRPPAQAAGDRRADGGRRLARARGAEPRRAPRAHPQGRRAGRPRRLGAAQVEALGRLRSIPNGFERSRTGGEILEAVERGLARDPATVPVPERPAAAGRPAPSSSC